MYGDKIPRKALIKSELFKEDYDAVLHENTCIIGLCELISASLAL